MLRPQPQRPRQQDTYQRPMFRPPVSVTSLCRHRRVAPQEPAVRVAVGALVDTAMTWVMFMIPVMAITTSVGTNRKRWLG